MKGNSLKTGSFANALRWTRSSTQVLSFLAISILLVWGPSFAVADSSPFKNPTEIARDENAGAIGFRNGSVVVAPIPFESPSLGQGFALGGAYLFKNDQGADASSIGGGVFRTSNGSEGFALGANVGFSEGDWTLKFLLMDAKLNYDLYSQRQAFAVSQDIKGVSLEARRGFSETMSGTVSLGYGKSTLSRREGGVLPPDYLDQDKLELTRLSFGVDRDTRDDTMYPRSGSFVESTLTLGQLNGGRSYEKALLTAKAYRSVSESGVLAGQVVLCAASNEAPFLDACALGAVDAFRGYVATEFIDDALISAQIEYRQQLIGRLGFVAFAGVGVVGSDFGDALDSDVLASVGLGARIRLSKSFPVDYALDVSVNERGDSLLYISVGQRF